MEIEEVAEQTYRLETPIPGAGIIFSVYLIDVDGGVLIEPGPSAAVPVIQEGMKQLGMHALSWIIPTHIHMDHGGGAGMLAELFPRAQVIGHPSSTSHLADPSRLVESTRITYGDDFEELYGPVLPVPKSQIKVTEDGELIIVGGRELQILYAPGHAPHHIAIYDRKTKGLFCGESLGMATPDPLPAPAAPSFNMDECLSTMRKMEALDPDMLFYSHGGVGHKPRKLISRVIENTITFADMVLASLKRNDSPQMISDIVTEYASTRFPPDWEEGMVKVWQTGIVEGYSTYFRSKGLA